MPVQVEQLPVTGNWLSNGPIFLWRAKVQAMRPWRELADTALSREERQRRNRYAFADDAERFTLGRFLLRLALVAWPENALHDEQILARASRIQFVEEKGRAPRVSGVLAQTPRFSLSRSGDDLVVAIGMVTALGVDIEKDDHAHLLKGSLLNEFFSSDERLRCNDLPEAERAKHLLQLWTGKEALVKAAGVGLHAPLCEIVLEGEHILALPPLIKTNGHCSLRFIREADASLAIAWW